MKNDGKKKKLWKLKINNSYVNSLTNHAVVDHLKIDKTSSVSVDYIFGTTRTRLHGSSSDTKENIYIFRLQTTSKTDNSLASGTTNVKMKKLDPAGFSIGSYFTGIYDKLESNGE